MSQALNDLYIKAVGPADRWVALNQSIKLIEMESQKSGFIQSHLPVIKDLMDNIVRLFEPKDVSAHNVKLHPLSAELSKVLEARGYQYVRSLIVDIPPGFVGHTSHVLKVVLNDFIPGLKSLSKELDILKREVAHILNGGETLNQMTGILPLAQIQGVSPVVMKEINASFTKRTVSEGLFGQHYQNLREFFESYKLASLINFELSKVNLTDIRNKSESFKDLINDLRQQISEGGRLERLSAKAVTDLSAAVERAATAVSLSSIVPDFMVELTEALNSTQDRLAKQLQ